MLINTWTISLQNSLAGVINTFANFIPKMIGAILVLAIGWLIGIILSRIFTQIFDIIKFDAVLKYGGFDEVLHRAGIKLNSSLFVGTVIKWIVIIVFAMFSLNTIGLGEAADFIKDAFVTVLPGVFLVATILIITAMVARFVDSIVVSSAKVAEVDSAKFIGKLSKWFVWVIGALTAFAQTGLDTSFLYTLFTGAVLAFSLAFGLAFGIGGQDAARDILKGIKDDFKK